MNKESKQFFDTILSTESSVEAVRAAFANFAMAVIKSQSSFDKKKEEIEKDMHNGTRRTAHRFRI